MERIKNCFRKIDTIKAGGGGGNPAGRPDERLTDANRGQQQSYLRNNLVNEFASGISNFVYKTGSYMSQIPEPGAGGPRNNMNEGNANPRANEQEDKVRDKLREIDEILTKECLFCGSMLIDMVDNDIEVSNKDGFDDLDDAEENPAQGFGGRDQFQSDSKIQQQNEWFIE